MTKKHFEYMANALRCARPGENWDANKKVQWDLCVRAVADTCKHFNGAFDRERFLKACGGLFDA
jgi:hypothetical protein